MYLQHAVGVPIRDALTAQLYLHLQTLKLEAEANGIIVPKAKAQPKPRAKKPAAAKKAKKVPHQSLETLLRGTVLIPACQACRLFRLL